MKTCPKCCLSHPNAVSICDCGYKFPATRWKQCPRCLSNCPDTATKCDCGYSFSEPRRNTTYLQSTSNEGCTGIHEISAAVATVSFILWGLTVVCFLLSAWWTCTVLTNLGQSESPLTSLAFAAAGLLLGVASLYPLKATVGFTDWNISTEQGITIAAVIILEIVGTCCWGSAYILSVALSGD
jgi:hypothetical protein